MTKLLLYADNRSTYFEESEIRIAVELPSDWGSLQINYVFTHEGMVRDVVDNSGEVVETSSQTYDEVLEEMGLLED